MDLLALLQCLHPGLSTTTLRQLSLIALALLTMTGRITMTGIARWSGDGASYRTIVLLLTPCGRRHCGGC